ncbi:hypothetical protein VIGAN_08226200 [Vigna angularis var. angularis]|uniref:Uncharacterized protein n=1 Tax=Vigna angularis var. angularis TaxID=157739 RepID=A0A0S3SRR3_PHAAN|nr:hypothetical protein VIGAN_08226200 [Vigna angularis var. angularis]
MDVTPPSWMLEHQGRELAGTSQVWAAGFSRPPPLLLGCWLLTSNFQLLAKTLRLSFSMPGRDLHLSGGGFKLLFCRPRRHSRCCLLFFQLHCSCCFLFQSQAHLFLLPTVAAASSCWMMEVCWMHGGLLDAWRTESSPSFCAEP